jgi:hypothetical protein
VRALLASVVDRLTDEFEGIYDRGSVSAVVDVSAQELSRGTVKPFVPVLAERFARERLTAQAQAEGRLAKVVPNVVFVSLTGGGRSEIGAALLARNAGDSVSIHSAGSQAGSEIDENVRAALKEVGVDLSEAFHQATHAGGARGSS